MTKSAMIRARINPDLKEQVEEILEKIGLNATEAITLFYKQIQLNKGIPFELKIPNKTTKRTMEKTDRREELHTYASTKEMFDSWDEL